MSTDSAAKPARILVAEDDPSIALAVREIVGKAFACDCITVAEDGDEAWAALQAQDYDLVIADWNMPKRTGAQLLVDVRGDGRVSHLPVVMLTARSDRDSIVEAVGAGATDYVVKPFARQTLIEKLAKLLDPEQDIAGSASPAGTPAPGEYGMDVGSILRRVRHRFDEGAIKLPALPGSNPELEGELGSGFMRDADVARVVSTDPASMAALIKLANSAFFRGGGAPVRSLEQAIARIGTESTRSCVLFIHSRESPAEDGPYANLRHRLWMHSVATAAGARTTAESLRADNPEELFAMGLLHDIGTLAVLQLLSELDERASAALINEVCARLHAELGAELLVRWELPREFVRVCRWHHDPGQAGNDRREVEIVHFADLLAAHLEYRFDGCDTSEAGLDVAAARLGLDDHVVRSVCRDTALATQRLMVAAGHFRG